MFRVDIHPRKIVHRPLFPTIALLFSVLFVGQAHAADSVRVYPAPPGEPLSRLFKVAVNGQDAPVYTAIVNAIDQRAKPDGYLLGDANFASFDFQGAVTVTITYPSAVGFVKILPVSSGITPTVSGAKVTFTISKPSALTLEVHGDWMNSLHIFANPWDADAPDPHDPNVLYFGPGIHEINSLHVDSGKTVYVAGGAVIYGKPTASHPGGPVIDLEGSNITLRGRGIIDGSLFPKPSPNGDIVRVKGSNITITGIILRDASFWTLPIHESDHVKIQNIKIFGWRGNSDGIDINNSHDVEVSDCFLRTFDDLVVIKATEKGKGESRDILVKNCVLWNEIAHALSIGAELRENVENVVFTDCDIIHDKGREWLLRVFDTDSGTVKNIAFQNIRIEESRRLLALWIGKAVWSRDADRGHIANITFRNIVSPQPEADDQALDFKGFDANCAIDNVTLDGIQLGGKPLAASAVTQNAFVHNVTVKP